MTVRVAAALLSLCVLGALPTSAQTPTLLRDVNQTPASEPSSWPSGFSVLGGHAYFFARTRATGNELFRTDGTAIGTVLVLDSLPGPDDGAFGALVAWGGAVALSARHPVLGEQLWVGDGSPQSFVPLLGVQAATGHTALGAVQPIGNALLFVADTASFGPEWWITDGTTAGTRLVVDLNPGSYGSYPIDVRALAGGVFFVADDLVHGREPWITDGTANGTRLLADIVPGGGSSNCRVLADLGGRLLLYHDVYGVPSFWVTDGTAAGTVPIPGGPTVTANTAAVVTRGTALFPASDASHGRELWSSDGTVNGTRLVADLSPGTGSTPVFPLGALPDGRVLAGIAASAGAGLAGLWITDGTASGTTRISTVQPHGSQGAQLGGALVFRASDGPTGDEPWRSDGTPQGTQLVRDVLPGTGSSAPAGFARLGSELLFAVLNPVPPAGVEPWLTDGTANGTRLLANVAALPPGATASSDPSDGVDWNGRAMFVAWTGARHDAVLSDGTPAGTAVYGSFPGPDPFPQLNENGNPRLHVVAGDLLALADDPSYAVRMWLDTGNGPVAGPLLALLPGSRPLVAHATVGDVAWLSGNELWHVRGLTATRAPLPSTPPHVYEIARAGQAIVFTTFENGTPAVWRCDADNSCTRLVLASAGVSFGDVVGARRKAFFVRSNDPATGDEPCVTDGTAAGTRVIDVWPGPTGIWPRLLAAYGDGALFLADDGSGGRTLWATDGTLPGTVRLDPFPPGTVVGEIEALWPIGLDRFAFTMPAAPQDTKLWLLDRSGARVVPGAYGSVMSVLGTAGEEIYFAARAPLLKLWRSDGTAAGTIELLELQQVPQLFAVSAGLVYFDHDDLTHGSEPFVVPAGATVQTLGTPCGVGMRAPYLAASDPVLGRTLTLRGGDGPPGAVGIVVLGRPAPWPIAHAGGCVEYVDATAAIVLLQLADAGREFTASWPLPADPGLIGVHVAVQSYCGPSTNALGVELSAGLRLTLDTW
ncbi:MAG: hypothetical protein IPM29_25650 [Planctomycetes bacterium]|nr:hypothetical protein [Planctomycetota bacterium]